MPKVISDYSQTIIYKLCCKDLSINEIYIGHTTNFIQRKNTHKICCNNFNNQNYNRYVYKFIRENGGWDNWSMVQIEEHNCKNKREAESIEQYWIEKTSAKLNSNKPYAMCLEQPQLYKKCWYDENKTEVLEKAKQHYLENKEEKINYQKQYTEENKEQIKSYQEEYREKNKEKLAEQKKEYRAIHKEEATEKQKMWKETNKEKLKEQRSQIINCECGFTYTFGNKHRHIQSKSHNDYQNKLCGIITETKTNTSEEEKLELLNKKQKENKDNTTEKNKNLRKIYNEENKEQIKEQTHKYYEEHKEEIKQKTKLYAEENKEKVKEYKDEWYQKNKEKILTKQKESFLCDCGSKVRCSGKAEHLRSEKHKKYINNS